jgi:hypothetical protein
MPAPCSKVMHRRFSQPADGAARLLHRLSINSTTDAMVDAPLVRCSFGKTKQTSKEDFNDHGMLPAR